MRPLGLKAKGGVLSFMAPRASLRSPVSPLVMDSDGILYGSFGQFFFDSAEIAVVQLISLGIS